MTRQAINTGSSDNDPTAESIRAAFTKVNSMTTDLYATGHNVLAYGALGNSHHFSGGGADDTSAIQAAYDAAEASTGVPVVIFPGNHTYRITSAITVPIGVHTIGLGGLDYAPTGTPPIITYNGSAGGRMMDVVTSSTNIFHTRFQNIALCGKTTAGNSAEACITFRNSTGGNAARTDTGTVLQDVVIFSVDGDGIRFEGRGATNFRMTGGRFDGIIGGYGCYVDLTASDAFFVGVFDGNVNWTGGGSTNGHGFLHLDGSGSGGGAHVTLAGLHTECNQDLIETFASGANPYDKQGVIRLGCNPSLVGVQHEILVNGWNHSFPGGIKSHSIFQLTSTSGTDDEVSDMCMIQVDNGHGMHAFTSADSGATDEIRLFGGKVPSNRRYSFTNGHVGRITWGQGRDFNGTAIRSYTHHRHGNFRVRGLGLQLETVSNLPAFVYGGAGSMAAVSDANATTRGSTVAGGGSNFALVVYNGTNWIIV